MVPKKKQSNARHLKLSISFSNARSGKKELE